MCEEENLKLTRKYLKYKILCDDITWRGSSSVRERVSDLIRRTIKNGEAHSALIIGPRGCGKTTLVRSVLAELDEELNLEDDAVVIRLNGLLHREEKLALQAICSQMNLESVSAVQKLDHVIRQLSGACRSMLFLLEEFQDFCSAPLGQTMLYNLFDLTHSASVPICVLGITSRLDVMELLEKRVKSRFSHNHIFIFPNECENGENNSPVEYFTRLFVELLSLPNDFGRRKPTDTQKRSKKKYNLDRFALPQKAVEKYGLDLGEFESIDKEFVSDWNEHIETLSMNERVVDSVEKFCYYSVNEQIFRDMLLHLLSEMPFDSSTLSSRVDACIAAEARCEQLRSLTVLQVSLLIAMMHTCQALAQPINLEMLLNRYNKFINTNSTSQAVPRPVILKAFEQLADLELVVPARGGQAGTREHRLYNMAVTPAELKAAVAGYTALPTEIAHWVNNSIV